MKLLKITDEELTGLDPLFEETESVSLESIAPQVMDGEPDVKLDGGSVDEYDAVYAQIPTKNAEFGRVALEIIEEKGIEVNYPSTGFFIMSKKNYLYHVLHEKEIPATRTVVVASEKASRNVERSIQGPLLARKFDEDVEIERAKLEAVEEIGEFCDGIDRGNMFVLFQKINTGDRYRCLVTPDSVISLADNSEGWDFSTDNLQYHTISQEKKQIVRDTRKAIGTNVAEVLLRNGKVEDVNPNPDLDMYKEISGKDAFEAVAESLRGDEE